MTCYLTGCTLADWPPAEKSSSSPSGCLNNDQTASGPLLFAAPPRSPSLFSSPVSTSRMCHRVHISPPSSPSVSWKTVSMWQSSPRWKRSRLLAVDASSPSSPGATSGSYQLHSDCQPEAVCEAVPRSTVSHQRSPRCFGFPLKEFHHPGFFYFFLRNNTLKHGLVLI